ncbi:hypothetical protein AAC387_Pa09g1648 [Persea americana]
MEEPVLARVLSIRFERKRDEKANFNSQISRNSHANGRSQGRSLNGFFLEKRSRIPRNFGSFEAISLESELSKENSFFWRSFLAD